jgi:hypothetical protein
VACQGAAGGPVQKGRGVEVPVGRAMVLAVLVVLSEGLDGKIAWEGRNTAAGGFAGSRRWGPPQVTNK